jgi:flagellar protein FlaJ
MAKETKKKLTRRSGYNRYLESNNIRVVPIVWFTIAIIVSLALGVLLLMAFPKSPTVAIMTFIAVPVLIVGFPILMKEHRDTKIENAISDVFEELATSLRAGATVEQALLDLTKIQRGPLIDELKMALNDMEGGYSFEEALENIIDRADVLLLKRILKIVIDGRKAGGELANILDAVASDARDMARLQRERSSKTLMYVIFLFAAGGIVAPLIFGFVTEISMVIVNITNQSGTALMSPLELSIFGLNVSILWLYLIIECAISGVMMAFVRGAKVWKGILFYSLTMMLASTIVFELAKMVAGSMLSSSTGGAV